MSSFLSNSVLLAVYGAALAVGLGLIGLAIVSLLRSFTPGSQASTSGSGRRLNRGLTYSLGLGAAVLGAVGLLALLVFRLSPAVSLLWASEYLAITAHVARGNGLWDGRTLTTENLREYAIPGSLVSLPVATSVPATPAPVTPMAGGVSAVALLLLVGGVAVLIALGGFVLWLKRGRSN